MAYILVRHKVRDFAAWKPIFDGHGLTRKAAGSRGGFLFRRADNPQEVIVLFEWDSVQNARKFAESQDLKGTMERAGVIDRPDIYFLDQVDRPSA
jgi:heme-degrading monooxygenase HmoA